MLFIPKIGAQRILQIQVHVIEVLRRPYARSRPSGSRPIGILNKRIVGTFQVTVSWPAPLALSTGLKISNFVSSNSIAPRIAGSPRFIASKYNSAFVGVERDKPDL